jgi:uroporphyrinogen-III synthase
VTDARPSRVLVTRSEPGASETAERLSARGYAPIVEPLFVIEAVASTLPAFDALAFTSLNGVRRFAALSPRRDAPVFCVGERSANEAREAGFAEVYSANGDVTDLVGLIESCLPRSARLLHAGNEDSRGDLAGTLARKGWQAVFVPTFRAASVSVPGPALAVYLGGEAAFDAALIHSPRGGSVLAGFLRAASSAPRLNIAAISQAAAQPLRNLARRVEIAAEPNEAALLKSLERLTGEG